MRQPCVGQQACLLYDPRPPRLRLRLRPRLRLRLQPRLRPRLGPHVRTHLARLRPSPSPRPSLNVAPRPNANPAIRKHAGCLASQAKVYAGCGPIGVNLFIYINVYMLLIFKILPRYIKILSKWTLLHIIWTQIFVKIKKNIIFLTGLWIRQSFVVPQSV